MNDSRIVIGIGSSGVNVMAARRALGHKGVEVALTCSLVDGRLPGKVLERLARFDPKKESEVIFVLPRRQVALKYLSLPSNNPDELRRMVDLQIGQGLPFPPEEIVHQMVIGDKDASGYTRVIVAVARRQMVEESLALAAKSNLFPGRCAVSAFGIAAWHARHFPSDVGRTVLVADADSEGVDLCFCRDKKLLFARSLMFADGQSVLDEALQEIRLTMDAFEREYPGRQIDKIILTGVEVRAAFLKEVFSQTLQVPLEEVSITKGFSVDEVAAGDAVPKSLCACLGIALAADPGPDLTPSSVLDLKFMRARRLSLVRFGVAVVLTVGAVALAVGLELHRRASALDTVRQRLAVSKQEAQDARRKIQFFELIRRNLNARISIAQLMSELYGVIPQTTALTSVQLSDGALTIQGQSKESTDVNLIQKSMMESALFKDVTLQYANRPQRLAMEYTEFKILCRLRAGGEGQP
jgi:Tfp pilus assembly protein PilN